MTSGDSSHGQSLLSFDQLGNSACRGRYVFILGRRRVVCHDVLPNSRKYLPSCCFEFKTLETQGVTTFFNAGSTSPIGRAVCQTLARQGARLVLGCRSLKEGEDLAQELEADKLLTGSMDGQIKEEEEEEEEEEDAGRERRHIPLLCDLASLSSASQGAQAYLVGFKLAEDMKHGKAAPL
jgi:hypothetical protein